MLRLALISLFSLSLCAQPKPLEWTQIDQETLKHFSALVQINSADPGGSEKPVVDYLKAVFDREGIESKVFTRTNLADPNIIRPNIIARLKGTGKKKPLLIIGHTDTVKLLSVFASTGGKPTSSVSGADVAAAMSAPRGHGGGCACH